MNAMLQVLARTEAEEHSEGVYSEVQNVTFNLHRGFLYTVPEGK
jgi:hypothetical protein